MSMLNVLKNSDLGLLIIRLGIGGMFIAHGIPKLMGGAATFEGLGKAMAVFGITAFPKFWGFMGAVSETLGGLLFLVGYKTRFATMILFGAMFVATFFMYDVSGGDLLKYGWPLEMAIFFLGLTFVGPGRFSIDKG